MGAKLTFLEQYNLLNGRLLMDAFRLLNKNFKAAQIDITREQWTVLAILWQRDGIAQQVIVNETGRDKPSTTRLLNHLEKLEYIKRQADVSDKRTNLIYLTTKGKKAKNKIMSVVETTFALLTDNLSEQQVQTVRDVVKIIYSNIENR
ncbi:MarR family winged helix-turn-helix transcriptional regulator [Pedobacter sp.]